MPGRAGIPCAPQRRLVHKPSAVLGAVAQVHARAPCDAAGWAPGEVAARAVEILLGVGVVRPHVGETSYIGAPCGVLSVRQVCIQRLRVHSKGI